jgi:alpha-L-fucosidase
MKNNRSAGRRVAMGGILVLALLQVWDAAGVELPKPTAVQYAWQEQERIQFVCLDPATWQGREYDNHSTPLRAINPAKLDTEQWCRAAELWGAKEILFVAKHTGGFCWWQTETSHYGIKETPWHGGKGDVLANLATSCHKHGLALGIYIYPGDDQWGAGIGSGGRTKDPGKQAGYNQIFRRQMTEVLTRYGQMREVWFDGSCVIDVSDILAKYASNAVIFQGPGATIRWVGTESGKSPYPAWNTLKSADLKTGTSTAVNGNPDGDAWAPLECDTTLYQHFWFWSAPGEQHRKSLAELMDIYYQSAGHGAVLLLNSTPNTNGLIPSDDMNLYQDFGSEISRRFRHPIAAVQNQRGDTIDLTLSRPQRINQAVVMEDYRAGEHIREYVIEGLCAGHWQQLGAGTSVGRKKIEVFPPVLLSQVRLRVTQSAATPVIRSFAVFAVAGGFDGPVTTNAAPTAWQLCGTWKTGETKLTLPLTHFIPEPGQFDLKFEPDDIEVIEAKLFFNGAAAAPGQLTQSRAGEYHLSQTQAVTAETRIELQIELRANQDGRIFIRRRL